jgi:putative endonuclease
MPLHLIALNPEREDAKDPSLMAEYFVYMLTNKNRTVLYTGATDSLDGRLSQHKDKVFDGFTKKYNCDRLVYFEIFDNAEASSLREKQIKSWKDALIATMNPDWNDLSSNWRVIR